MTMTEATMTSAWRAELVWTTRRLWAREGQQAALRYLAMIGLVHGEDEEERIANDVMACSDN